LEYPFKKQKARETDNPIRENNFELFLTR